MNARLEYRPSRSDRSGKSHFRGRRHFPWATAWAWALWILLGITAVVIEIDNPTDPWDVAVVYQTAAQRVLAGEDIYSDHNFLYLPTSAVAMTPLALMPYAVASSLLRVLGCTFLALGTWRFTSFLRDTRTLQGPHVDLFLAATLPAVLLTAASVRQGQMTAVMEGILLLSFRELGTRRWTPAAALLAVAFSLKPLALPFVLLAAALYPIRWRLVAAVTVLHGVAALVTSPRYLARQYAALPELASFTAHRTESYDFSNLYGILSTLGWRPRVVAIVALALLGALATLALVRKVADWPPGRRELMVYALGSSYVLLFSPTTERNTYGLMGPAVGLLLVLACAAGRRTEIRVIVSLLLISLVSRRLWLGFPHTPLAMLRPLVFLVIAVIVASWVFRDHGFSAADATDRRPDFDRAGDASFSGPLRARMRGRYGRPS